MTDFSKPNPWVEVRLSSRHGSGLFAKCDIPAKTLVCYYAGTDYNKHHIPLGTDLSYALSAPWDKDTVRVGAENPPDEWGVGQIANDYLKPDPYLPPEIREEDNKLLAQFFVAHQVISDRQTTLQCGPASFDMYTTRPVLSGEELTFSYGISYWIRHTLERSNHILWRLVLFSILPYRIKFEEMNNDMAEYILKAVVLITEDNPFWDNVQVSKEMSSKDRLLALVAFMKL